MNLAFSLLDKFSYNFTVKTNRTKEDVIGAFKVCTETKDTTYMLNKLITKDYVGKVSKDNFQIKKVNGDRPFMINHQASPMVSPFLEHRKLVSEGEVGKTDDGALVSVRIKLPNYYLYILLGILAFILIIGYDIISSIISEGVADSEGISSLTYLAIVFITVVTVAFVRVVKFKEDIKKIILGSEYKPLLGKY